MAKEVKEEVVVPVKEEEFNQNKALEVLVQAIKLAQKRGAFELEETELILKAIRVFIPKV